MGITAPSRSKVGEIKKPSDLLKSFGLSIEVLPIDQLKPYPENPRNHPRKSVDAIANSIESFGFKNVVLVDKDNEVIYGHGRIEAAKRLGLKTIPVLVDQELSKDQARALRIADNQIQSLSEWNELNLKEEILKLQAAEINLQPLGFDIKTIDAIIGSAPSSAGIDDLDIAPPKKPVTKVGDLWILGNHRLLCGDSTKEADVARLMDGEKAALFSTDPPYLVDYTGDDRPGKAKDWSTVYHEVDIKNASKFFEALFSVGLKHCVPNVALYCWHADKRVQLILQIWEALKIHRHQTIIWRKPSTIQTYSFYPYQHEPCLMGWPEGKKPRHNGDASHTWSSVWDIDWEGKARVIGNEHPTQKPIEIFARPMLKHTYPGEICYEPFSGSGSQILAGELKGRKVYAMEIEPAFCDVAIARWEKLTGQMAVLSKKNSCTKVALEDHRVG